MAQIVGTGDNNDKLVGTLENDVLKGLSGDDTLKGLRGDDELFGHVGDDTLFGHVGNDTLNGGLGSDTLNGGLGNDVLIGGPGADILIGGPGSDTFVFTEGDIGGAVDTIIDFSSKDVLDIAGFDYYALGAIADNGDNSFTFNTTDGLLTVIFENGFSSFTADNFVSYA